MPDDPNYKVGYRRPPLRTRFRKGRSGNPKGRPKAAPLDIARTLHDALVEKVVIKDGGRPRRMRKFDVAITQQINKAAAGDIRALQLLTMLLRECNAGVTFPQAIKLMISETDSKL